MRYHFFIYALLFVLPAHAQIIDTLILHEEHAVLFDSDRWELTETEILKLDSLRDVAQISDSISLEGHTDEIGSEVYNQKLSSRRVQSVFTRFSALGIAEEKIKLDEFGELAPAIRGNDESAYKFNRRVVIKFFKLEQRRNLNGKVEEESTRDPLIAKVKITGKNFVDSVYTTLDGTFSIAVPDNGVYKLEISADNHFFEQRFIKISASTPSEFTIGLPEITLGSIYTLPNFNFKGDLPILLPRSVPTLDLLFELLNESELCIEIKGHINLPNRPDCGLDTRHYKLSVDRANMVYKNMIANGIDSLRMLPKGYGNWEMLYPKATLEKDMVKNRRVEIKIIDCQSEELQSKL